MAGTAVTPAPVPVNGEETRPLTPSQVNMVRIAAVIDRMDVYLRKASKFNSDEFYHLCLSLARGIDFAVSNQEIPSRVQELPSLLKQVCQTKNDVTLEAATMVVMISIKNACQSKWFSDEDCEELCDLANEMARRFCTSGDFNIAPSNSLPIISTIMSRFYPRMKMGQILISLKVKPGFGAYVKDFHISKQMSYSPDEKLRLFVAQTDNVETSACLISPPQVNFLLNGKGVERRTNVFMDTGPQMPSAVTHILKYGSNLLQGVGDFNGNYIIAIALMSEISTTDDKTLEDYVQPAATFVDPDSEIIEGPSRISLNCPISFRRIKTPVKGQSCKHLQCFDFDNYLDINSKRPSWRCPNCNHHVCFTEIRIDQNMVKVLKDVGENVNDVIISSDGSWKAIMESDDHTEQLKEKFPSAERDKPEQPASTNFCGPSDLLDLTGVDDEMDAVGTCEVEDRKVFPKYFQAQSSAGNTMINPRMNNPNEVNQNNYTHMQDNFWSGIYLSTFGSGAPASVLDAQIGGIPEPAPPNDLLSPVLTATSSPAPNCEAGAFSGNALLATSGPESEISSPTTLQIQQFQFGHTRSNNEYGRSLSIPRHVSRTSVAVQALPAQVPSNLPQRSRNSMNTLVQTGHLAASQISDAPFIGDGFNASSSNMERQQQFSRSHANPLQVQRMASSSLQQHLNSQQDRPFYSVRPAQHITGPQAPNQPRGGYRVPSTLPSEPQNSNQQQNMNLRMPHTVNQSATAAMLQSAVQPSGTFLRAEGHQGGSQGACSPPMAGVNGQHSRMAAAQRAAKVANAFQMPRQASFSGNTDGVRVSPLGDQRGNMGSTLQSFPRPDALGNLPADQNWRPTSRMRGSLSGQAYSDALSQYIIQPTQQAQAARPPLNVASIPPNASSQLQILMANRAALQAANYPSTGLAGMSSASGVFPSSRQE